MASRDPLLGASWTRLEAHIMVDVPLPPQRGILFGMSGRNCATSDHEDTGEAIHIAAMQLVDVSRGTDLRVTHGGDPCRRETRSLLYVPLTRSQRGFTSDHFCGENREHQEACSGFFSSSIEDDDLDALWVAC